MLQLVLGQSPVCLTAFFDYTLTYTLFYPFLGLKDTFLQGILQIEELGELIGVVTLEKNGLMSKDDVYYKGSVKDNEDANNYTKNGIWFLNSFYGNKQNFPSNVLGYLRVLSPTRGYIYQELLVIKSDKPIFYRRSKGADSDWSEWIA